MASDSFFKQVNKIGISLIGQTGNLAPADKKLYALRDVTATVDDRALISASIMSKKLAAGDKNIVLDVKCGSGAFMKNEKDAAALAKNNGRHRQKLRQEHHSCYNKYGRAARQKCRKCA